MNGEVRVTIQRKKKLPFSQVTRKHTTMTEQDKAGIKESNRRDQQRLERETTTRRIN